MYSFKEIEVTELQRLLQDQARPVRLIDVRSPAEVQRGAIPGAENLPLHLLPIRAEEVAAGGVVETAAEAEPLLVFYCQSGARSAQACAFMTARGYDNVCNLRGGIMSWMQGGLAVA